MAQLLSSCSFFSLSTFRFTSCDGVYRNHPCADLSTFCIQISPDGVAFSVGFANFFLIENGDVLRELFPSDSELSVE
jgi:hypothetical protein